MKKIDLLNITGQEVAELCGYGELYRKGINQFNEENFDQLLSDFAKFNNCINLNPLIHLLSEEECKQLEKLIN